MKNLDSFVSIAKLPTDATSADVVAKVNELVAVINDLVPSHIGEDGLVTDEE